MFLEKTIQDFNTIGKLSAWSENFINGYDKERHNQFKQELSDKMTGADFDRSNNVFCREHYETEKDYLDHQTKNIDFFIRKYGKEEGTKRWNAKRKKWLDTMNSKSDEEKAEINKKKIYKKGMISDLEKDIVIIIQKSIDKIKHQFQIRNGTRWYVYDIQYKNKIIEINGDYWHSNPEIYVYDSFISLMNMTALEIWERDRKKTEFAQSQGYEVLTIWESDYKHNKQQVIEQCLHFLTQ